jgi:hypothetical protein
MLLIARLIVVAAIWLGSGALCTMAGISSAVGPTLVFFGSVSFFLGTYMTGAGFMARGSYVDTATPEVVWKGFGVVLWIAALVTMLYMRSHQGA